MSYDWANLKKQATWTRVLGDYYGADMVNDGGGRYAVVCIFHDDKNPSMKLFPDGHFKCFGCDAHGDVVDIVQKLENLYDKTDAVTKLAEICFLSDEEIKKPTPTGLNPKPASKVTAMPKRWTPATQNRPQEKPTERPAQKPQPNEPIVWPKPKAPMIEWGDYVDVETYTYNNPDGTPRFEVVRKHRYEQGSADQSFYDKTFTQRWRHEDGCYVTSLSAGKFVKITPRGTDEQIYIPFNRDRHSKIEDRAVDLPAIERILFNADFLINADEVYLVEGEKDVRTLTQLGLVATTPNSGSKAPWLPSFTEQLRGKQVIHIPDNDKSKVKDGKEAGRQGQQFADVIEKALEGAAAGYIRIGLMPEYKDITEYLESKGDDREVRRDFLNQLVNAKEQERFEEEIKIRGFVSVRERIAVYPGGVEAFLDYSRRPKGFMTGFDQFDSMTMGLMPGELFVLAARPAMGKSSFALDLAMYGAMQGFCMPFCAAEMSAESLMMRAVCSMANVSIQKFRSGYLTAQEKSSLSHSMHNLLNLPLMIDDTALVRPEQLFEKLLRLSKEHDIGAVVVDYLQLLQGKGENKVVEVGNISRDMKLIGKELKKPMVVLSQLSRGPETRPGDHRPMLSDLRESGAIEQDADMVGFIFREFVYRPDKPDLEHKAELMLAKQRNGPTGTIHLRWNAPLTRFENPPGPANYANDPAQYEDRGRQYGD